MSPLLTKAWADVRRHRVQTAVVLVVVLLATGTATLGLTLMAQASNPYDSAFAAQRGAHLQVFLDSARVTREQAAATGSLAGAVEVGGPWLSSGLTLHHGAARLTPNVDARDDPGGPVGRLQLTAGRWAAAPGEVVVARSLAEVGGVPVGTRLQVVGAPARPSLLVVGEAADVDEGEPPLSSQWTWVPTSAFAGLTRSTDREYHVAYRFPGAPGPDQLQRAIDRVKAALPQGAVTGTITYLELRDDYTIVNSVLTTVLLAFSVFALGASVAIVVNLVVGVVLAGYREVGVLKALGCTPAQVVGALVLRMLIPTAAGGLLGVAAGTLLGQPLLAQSGNALGLSPRSTLSPWPALLTLAGMTCLVALAAALPGLRAGRLQPARAIAAGAGPSASGGAGLRRALAGRLPLPLGLGGGDAVARPLRAVLTVAAVVVGVATVVAALGTRDSLDRAQASETHAASVQVVVSRDQAYTDASVRATLDAQPETARVVGRDDTVVSVSGLAAPVRTLGFQGDSERLGYLVIGGRWFHGEGEALAPRGLLQDAHLRVGDRTIVSAGGRSVPVTIVGEVYQIGNGGHTLFLDWSTYRALRPDAAPTQYQVTLRPGADVGAYVRRVAATEPDLLSVQAPDAGPVAPVAIIEAVATVLAVVLTLIAVAGVFNTLLLNTRERLRETAVLKALGMTPGQVVAMVVASALALALAGGLLGLPAGVAIHHALLVGLMPSTGNDTPPQTLDVFGPVELLLVFAGGLLVAAGAAALPARWSARIPVARVLHAE